jgi:16S rRNA A1518/A1519 N6-dimethyltransferase RsmA/KsgA/DIM1 with predicted DNA glycosylase/AP lyase activity
LNQANKNSRQNFNVSAKTLGKSDIAKREVLEAVSLMPPGLASNLSVDDFASLLKYLEELTDKNSPKLP